MPQAHVPAGGDRQNDILALADNVLKRLNSGLIDASLCTKIRTSLGRHVPSASDRTVHPAAEYDRCGTELWNTSSRYTTSDSIQKALPLLRSLSVLLLDIAYRRSSKKHSKRLEASIRVLRTSLRAAKTCIDATDFDLATDIFQRAADHVDHLTGGDRRLSTDDRHQPIQTVTEELVAEYWMMRAALAWKQDRNDLAENFMSKANVAQHCSQKVLEQYADLTYEIGKSMLKAQNASCSMTWLKKASQALDRIRSDDVTPEISDLRATIVKDLIRANLILKSEESLSHAAELIAYLESEHGPKVGVLLLKFDLLDLRQSTTPSEYHAILLQIIRTAILTKNTFRTIMLHVQKLHHQEISLAQQSLDILLASRLYEHGEIEYIEKAVVMRIWTCTTQATDDRVRQALAIILDDVQSSIRTGLTFTQDATHAALTLLWKCIESAVSGQKTETAEEWCRLGAHPLFASVGDLNKAKIARKQMIVALAAGRTTSAREAFHRMTEPCQRAPSSQYLLYRIALREGNDTLATDCLSNLANGSHGDMSYLYACVQEAQQTGSRLQAIAALQTILSSSTEDQPVVEQRHVLLRCTIQMLVSELERDPSRLTTLAVELRRLFEAAANHFRKNTDASDKTSFTKELEWQAKSSYNLALKYFIDLDAEVTLSILASCISFSNTLLELEKQHNPKYLISRALLCHYLSAVVAIILARSEDHVNASHKNYSTVLQHATAYQDRLQTKGTCDIISEDDNATVSRTAQMSRFEIEALIELGHWEALDATMGRATESVGVDSLDTLADLIITAHTVMVEQSVDLKHQQRIPVVMQAMVNRSWQQDGQDMQKLSRWLRCIFRMTVNTSPETALRILEQAASIASRVNLAPANRKYPAEELEWLASTAFNTAVDRYCASDVDGCRTWAEAALNLAQAATDSPALYPQMQGLWRRLQAQQAQI